MPSPKRFLDAGCGRGARSLYLAQLGLSGMAVDFSQEAISEASRLLEPFPSVEVCQANINSIEQDDFDIVVFLEVLEHIEDDAAALESIREKLMMGGHLILSVPARRCLWDIWDEYAGHLRRYEADELVQLLSRTGYKVISFQSGATVWRFILRPIANMLAWMRKSSWKQRTAVELTKKSATRLLSRFTIFDKSLKLLLNVTLFPFFLALEAMFARTFSVGHNYYVLAQRVR